MNEGAAAAPRQHGLVAGGRVAHRAHSEFIRPMARRAVERFAEAKGYPSITEAVMDEARGAFGM